ncbi:MAG: hypothetical protein ACHQ9S_25665 [Candidatus Binatia bacterium]
MPKRKGLTTKLDAVAICRRLKQFGPRFGTWGQFCLRFDIPRTTLTAWLRMAAPAMPDPGYLLRMARDGNLNLNWLLLGEGTELRERRTETPRGHALAAIAAELRATEPADLADHEQAWAHLAIHSDAAFLRAVEAIRPEYRRVIERLNTNIAFNHNLTQVYNALTRFDTPTGGVNREETQRGLEAIDSLRKLITSLNAPSSADSTLD